MAELVKPQYHEKSKYPSGRTRVYDVRPAQEQYRGPDENAGIVDLSTSKIFDAVQEGVGIFGEIYKKSEETANALQAKSLLVDKMKDTQRITELLATELGRTGYQHLKLKDVLDKYKSTDIDGKTKLFIGQDLEHNVSALQMPYNISPEVKALIEDEWLRMDVGIVSDLIGQVEVAQSKQVGIIMSQEEMQYKQNLFSDFHTATDLAQARERASLTRKGMNAKIDSLALTMSWTDLEITDKKLKAGQLSLQEEFKYLYHRQSTSTRTAEQVRQDAINMAKNGEIKYEDPETGNLVKLDPDFYRDYVYSHAEHIRQEQITKRDADSLDSQKLELSGELRTLMNDPEFSFHKAKVQLLSKGRYPDISKSFIFNEIHRLEIQKLNEGKTEEEKALNFKLRDQLSVLTSELGTKSQFELHIQKYAKKMSLNKKGEWIEDKNGKWKTKSLAELKEITGLNNFEQRFIRDFITSYDTQEEATSEMLAVAQSDSDTQTFISQQEQRLDSEDGIASFLHDFAVGFGKDQYKVDDRKLEEGKEGARLLSELSFLKNPKFKNATRDQIIHAKRYILEKLVARANSEAKRLYEIKIKEQKGKEVTEDDMKSRLRTITGSYHENHEVMRKEGVEAYTDTTPSWKNKAPNLVQSLKIKAYKSALDKLADISARRKEYNIKELSDRIVNLQQYKINGVVIDDGFKPYITSYRNQIVSDLQNRMNDLTQDSRNIGFQESGQKEYFEQNGKYNIPKYLEWLEDRGISTSRPQVLSPADIDNFKNMKKGSIETFREVLQNVPAMINTYGGKHSIGWKMAIQNIYESVPTPAIRNFISAFVDLGLAPSPNDMDELYLPVE